MQRVSEFYGKRCAKMMKRMQKRGAAWILALVMVFAGLPGANLAVSARLHLSAHIHRGEVGDSITWRLDTRTGVLNVDGTGPMMWDWWDGAPWHDHMQSITSVVIADGVTHIGGAAFWGASNLTSVYISDSITTIGWSAFGYATGLISVDIPASVTYIGRWAFWQASNLTSIYMPSVTTIGIQAFQGASSLVSVYMPSVTHIGQSAFARASSLTEIRVAPGNVYYRNIGGVLFNYTATLLHTYPAGRDAVHYAVPDSITYIGDGAFSGASNLTSVYIPDSVTYIGQSAFGYATGLISIDIPASVTYIGRWAFWQASNLTSILYAQRDIHWMGCV